MFTNLLAKEQNYRELSLLLFVSQDVDMEMYIVM